MYALMIINQSIDQFRAAGHPFVFHIFRFPSTQRMTIFLMVVLILKILEFILVFLMKIWSRSGLPLRRPNLFNELVQTFFQLFFRSRGVPMLPLLRGFLMESVRMRLLEEITVLRRQLIDSQVVCGGQIENLEIVDLPAQAAQDSEGANRRWMKFVRQRLANCSAH
jgi:hypothetical protein